MKKLLAYKTPNWSLKLMNAAHRAILKISGGKLLRTYGAMKILELTTTGRKSGQQHTILLSSPVQVGEKWLVVASKGGDPKHPAWYLNLAANPQVTFNPPGEPPVKALASTVTSPEERAELWPKVVKAFWQYAFYQYRTERQIPLVWLEPVKG